MVGGACQDCVYSAFLDWANFEKDVVFCTHPHLGSIGNWAQRIVKGDQKPCEYFTSPYKESNTEPNRESPPSHKATL